MRPLSIREAPPPAGECGGSFHRLWCQEPEEELIFHSSDEDFRLEVETSKVY